MNKLDKSTEEWLEKVSRASSRHDGQKLAFGTIIVLSLIVSMSYVLSRVVKLEETAGNPHTPLETPVAIALAYFCTVLAASIIYLCVIEYRNRYRRNYASETLAEGIVYSSVVRHGGVVDVIDPPTEIMEIRKIRVAVRGLDKFLCAYVKVKVMEKGIYLQVPKWEKGDKIVVMYDSRKPRICRIADNKYIGVSPTNRRRL